MPTLIDVAFAVVVVVVVSILEHMYFWPRFRAAVAAERPTARLSAYRRIVIGEWAFGLAALGIWKMYGRSWSAMGLSLPHGSRLGIAVACVVAGLGLVVLQLWSVMRLPIARRIAARPKLGSVASMLPHTRAESGWFLLLSLTAGFCEELLYRGYLVWLFAPWIGYTAAMGLAVIFFGIGHAYQGRKGAMRATVAGAGMAAIALASGSIIPGMIVHALIDVGSGAVGYLLLRDQQGPASPAPISLESAVRVAS